MAPINTHSVRRSPRTQTLQALFLAERTYAVEAERGPRSTFKPRLFPGLSIRLRDVFAR